MSGSDYTQIFGVQPNSGAALRPFYIADVFNTSVLTADSTVIWTPNGNASFVLMGYTITVYGTPSGGDALALELLDGTTVFANYAFGVGSDGFIHGFVACDYGNGYESIATANDLTVALIPGLGSGTVAINTWGTELVTA